MQKKIRGDMATDWNDAGKGIQVRKLDTAYCHVRIHYSADPEKDPAWVSRRSARYGGVDTPKWRREMEIDYTAVQGQPVYPMLSAVHIAMRITADMAIYRIIDHGIRHPMACLWMGVARNGDRHIFREYYRSGATIQVNCQEVLRLTVGNVVDTLIDPATRQRVPLSGKDKAPVSVLSLYNNALGRSCRLADNSRAGYDSVRTALLSTLARKAVSEGFVDEHSHFAKQYFAKFSLTTHELLEMSRHPTLTFDPSCVRVFREMRNLRFRDLSGDPTEKAKPEEIMDFENDGPDCCRYGVQTKLRWKKPTTDPQPGSPLWDIQRKQRARRNKRYA